MTDSVFAALLAGRPEAQHLLPSRFTEPEAWRLAAEAAAQRQIAPTLLEELARQTQALPASAARLRNLELLAQPGTSVVVTGQQPGLFGGPLYTLHKAATAVARARMVHALTGRPCVPLFWLQSEDHDYAEIAQLSISTPAGRMTLALPAEAEPARVSLAHRVLPPETATLLDQLSQALAPLPHSADVSALLRECYAPGRPIVGAFVELLARLWGDTGLLFLDPRVPAVAALASPLLQRALAQRAAIAADLRERATLLAAAGCNEQVHTRAAASLVFFHAAGVTGPRYRLTDGAHGLQTPLGSVSADTLAQLFANEPLRFSSSALLRPLVQDTLLPTCAYLGGPAELSYFAQLPPLYARLGIPMPLIAPRARLRIIDPTTRSLLGRLGLQAAELHAPRGALLARVAGGADPSLSADALHARLLTPLHAQLDALGALALEGLADPIRKARESCEQALGKLAQKVERAALERDTITSTRLDRVLAALYPDGAPQERAYGFLELAARAGIGALTQAIASATESLDPGVRDVYL